MAEDRETKIRERAYRIWIDERSPDGRDQEHWAEAEQQIDEEQASPASAPATPAKKKG